MFGVGAFGYAPFASVTASFTPSTVAVTLFPTNGKYKTSSLTLSNGNLTAVPTGTSDDAVSASQPTRISQFQFECTPDAFGGTAIVRIGVHDGTFDMSGSTCPGIWGTGVCFGTNGEVAKDGAFQGSFTAPVAGDVLSVVCDDGAGTVKLYVVHAGTPTLAFTVNWKPPPSGTWWGWVGARTTSAQVTSNWSGPFARTLDSGFAAYAPSTGSYSLTAAVATFSFSPQSTTNLLRGYDFVAAAATFSYTGQNAVLSYGLPMTAAMVTFPYTGQAANLTIGLDFVAAMATFPYTGQAANLARGYDFVAAQGTFSYTGQDANLLYGYDLAASQAAFTYSGQAANLLTGIDFTAAAATFPYNGQAAILNYGRMMAADVATFPYAGQDATLTFSSAFASYSLAAAMGSFSYAGQPAILLQGYDFQATFGSFGYTGQPAGTIATLRMMAATGAFSYAGQSARGSLSLDTFPPMSVVSGVRVSAGLFG